MVNNYSENSQEVQFPAGDYISEGFSAIHLDHCFPNMVLGNPKLCPWPYLRREIPHNWYVDSRYPTIGFINRDEAHILYNTALKFKGKLALEIGCWMGWSACHLASAGVQLDVIDPILENPEFYESVSTSLKTAGVFEQVQLLPGYSPEKVQELANLYQRKWSLIFIDGNHDAPGPANDAMICEQLAEEDALILFHDLTSPDVAQGLKYFEQQGWNTMIYQTMQIMGVAWRGNVEPVAHQPDPTVTWQLPTHLKHYTSDMLVRSPEKEPIRALERFQTELDHLRIQVQSQQAELAQAHEYSGQVQSQLAQAHEEMGRIWAQLEQINVQLQQTQIELQQTQVELQQTRVELQQTQSELQQTQTELQHSNQQLEHQKTETHRLRQKLEQKKSLLQQQRKKLQQKQKDLNNLRGHIRAMETSKFWQIRKIWFKVKGKIGLKAEE